MSSIPLWRVSCPGAFRLQPTAGLSLARPWHRPVLSSISSSSTRTFISGRPPRSQLEHFTSNRTWPSSFPPYFHNSYSLSSSSKALAPRIAPYYARNFHAARPVSHNLHTAQGTPSASTTSNPFHKPNLPPLTQPVVAYYLLAVAALVFSLVVLGGLTRLTESGLSITEWNLVTGVLPPLSKASWQEALDKYLATPEGQSLNKNITMGDFQFIFGMEWAHRLLGRVTGLVFLAPIPYFLYKRMVSKATARRLLLIGGLIGAQGALGWYMVKSGLTREALAEANPSGVPRVSQYRLAAHLGMAFAVYAVCVREALAIVRDWELAARGVGIGGARDATATLKFLQTAASGRARVLVTALTALVFTTALSGAFVAGLDAGLLYNSFPTMGEGRIAPPMSELFDPTYARLADKSDLIRRNIFENPSTVQFDHRLLAVTTWCSTIAFLLFARRPVVRRDLPPQALRHIKEIAAMATIQASLGISTLWYMVPTWLASLHQTGSLILLTLCIAGGASLRKPGYAARLWIRAKTAPQSVHKTATAASARAPRAQQQQQL